MVNMTYCIHPQFMSIIITQSVLSGLFFLLMITPSFLSILQKKGAALSEGTSPYTFHTHASPLSVSSTPTGKGVVGGGGSEKAGATDMAVYGQLTSWPQLK